MTKRIPALIVSGFLGSGKTTLVGNLLEQAKAYRLKLAIISNEFGDTGIDRALLDAGEDGFVELDGGCVCCRLSDALGETVATVIERANPDRLLLETSGVAVPGEIVLNFWREPIEPFITGVIVLVVVDAERLFAPDADPLMFEQIEAADLLVLNKCDLIDEDTRNRAVERLIEVSGGRRVVCTSQGRISIEEVFPVVAGTAPPEHDHDHHHDEHDHDRFDSFALTFDGLVEPEAVKTRLRAEHAIRAKGFVRTPEGVMVVQGVGQRIELSAPLVPVAEALIGTVVVIRTV